MTVLFCVLGVFLIFGGVSMFCNPISTFLFTFLESGQFIGIAMAIYSVTGIVQCIKKRSFRADFFFSLLSLIASVFLLCDPLMQLMTDVFVLNFMAVWLLVSGIVTIILSVKLKKASFDHWWLQLIAGILNVLLGIFCFFNPAYSVVVLTVMIGCFFIDTGINMITLGVVFRSIR